MRRWIAFVPMVGLALMLGGCGQSPTPPAGGESAAKPASPSWLMTERPTDVMPVGEAKAQAEAGQTVAVRGRIGGQVEPISAESPVFLIVDPAIKHCGQLHGDTCPTPWDYCCEPRENLNAHSATVQVVDASGQPIADDLRASVLSPLDEVVVVGEVGPRPSPEVLTIQATGVHRLPSETQASEKTQTGASS